MFQVLEADTANNAWFEAANWFLPGGMAVPQQSRIGITSELLHAGISIRRSTQRWIASRMPAMNPAFAIAEVVWIINGRSDSAFLNFFNRKLQKFAGSGSEYHGAYGKRLRQNFGCDQLWDAYQALQRDSDSRQIVLQIWDPRIDMPNADGSPRSKDIPCNISSLLKVRDGMLEWTQIMRSNDFFLGLPHNIVQFTSLQEVVAGWLGLKPGQYHHFSDSLHLYTEDGAISDRITPTEVPENPDSLALSYSESQSCFSQFADFIDAIVNGLSANDILIELQSLKFNGAYTNLASIVAADALRRLGNATGCKKALTLCHNECLKFMFAQWCARHSFICN